MGMFDNLDMDFGKASFDALFSKASSARFGRMMNIPDDFDSDDIDEMYKRQIEAENPKSRIRHINHEAIDLDIFNLKYPSISINDSHYDLLHFMIAAPFIIMTYRKLYSVPEFIYELGETMAPNTFLDKIWLDYKDTEARKHFENIKNNPFVFNDFQHKIIKESIGKPLNSELLNRLKSITGDDII